MSDQLPPPTTNHPQAPPPQTSLGATSIIAALNTPSTISGPGTQDGNYPQNGMPGPMRHPPPGTQMRPVIAPYPPPQSVNGPGPMRPGPPFTVHQQPPPFPGQQNQGPPQVMRHMAPIPHPPPGHMPPGPMPGPGPSAVNMTATAHPQGNVINLTSEGAVIQKEKIDEVVKQIDPTAVLEENVKDALVEYMDEFVQDIVDKVCRLVQNRGNNKLETRDVELIMDMVYKMPSVPRTAVHVFSAPPTVVPKLDGYPPTDAHKQRMMMIKKQLKKL